ncbi:low molecular weight protein-tyrosine-phosphatase [Microlunatus panaciterrae]|uniref:protein-tyrosine-phosphatase n=1 Tax=Microlunatus panaciterrae TaxID=400768 RepID=A0ABS2RLF7_9ACTN|nr:protein-tyrosine phosphatase [Microlunatus panaciterrae]
MAEVQTHRPTSVRVVFVCWGNICRSPMAERVARRAAQEAGLTGVDFSSAATSSDELGAPMDPRAAAMLRRHGYHPDGHVAHRISPDEISSASLVIAMEDLHLRKLRALADVDHLRLLSDFDPDAEPGSGVPDPWYGSDEGFADTLAMIEAATPGVLAHVSELQRARV